MRKTALTVTISTLVMGVFGAFLHWLQEMNIFDAETGLATPMAGISVVFTAYSLAVLAAVCVISLLLQRRLEQPTDAETAMRVGSPLPTVIAAVCAVLFILASVQQMFTAGSAQSPLMQRIYGAAGIVAGAALLMLPGKKDGTLRSMGRTAALYIPLFFCYWLVLCYRDNAQDPVLWNFLVCIVAIAFSALAFYHLSAWFVHRARPALALVAIQYAVYLDLSALSDSGPIWPKLMLLSTAAVLATEEYILLSNMREKQDGAG